MDRGKLGWKWSVACDGAGIPIGVAINGANRNDLVLLDPTIDAIEAAGLLADIGTLSLDRGYDYPAVRARLEARGLTDLDIQKRGTKPKPGEPHRLTLGLRWIVETTTHGGRTTASSAAAPTVVNVTATLPSAWPPPC